MLLLDAVCVNKRTWAICVWSFGPPVSSVHTWLNKPHDGCTWVSLVTGTHQHKSPTELNQRSWTWERARFQFSQKKLGSVYACIGNVSILKRLMYVKEDKKTNKKKSKIDRGIFSWQNMTDGCYIMHASSLSQNSRFNQPIPVSFSLRTHRNPKKKKKRHRLRRCV